MAFRKVLTVSKPEILKAAEREKRARDRKRRAHAPKAC
jgi:hypothetical protein